MPLLSERHDVKKKIIDNKIVAPTLSSKYMGLPHQATKRMLSRNKFESVFFLMDTNN